MVLAGLYATLPYAVAQGTVEVPYVAVQCIMYSLITYFLIHFQVDAGRPLLSPSTATYTVRCQR